jgi:hypothetical protein
VDQLTAADSTLTLILMQRHFNIPVTMPVLLRSGPSEADGHATWEPGFAGLKSVRVLKSSDTRSLSSLSALDRERLLGVIALAKALQARDSLAAANACVRLSGLNDPGLKTLLHKVATRSTRYAQAELSRLVSDVLSEVKLKLWWSGESFRPALLCPDLRTALYVQALLSIVGGRALVVCPHCGRAFVQKRSDQDYCSVGCRDNHRIARWRAKRKRSLGKAKQDRKSRRKKS